MCEMLLDCLVLSKGHSSLNVARQQGAATYSCSLGFALQR